MAIEGSEPVVDRKRGPYEASGHQMRRSSSCRVAIDRIAVVIVEGAREHVVCGAEAKAPPSIVGKV